MSSGSKPNRTFQRRLLVAALAGVWLVLATWVAGCGGEALEPIAVSVLIDSQGLGDRSFVDQVYAGLIQAGPRAVGSLHLSLAADEDEAATLYAQWLTQDEEKPRLMIAVGARFSDVGRDLGCTQGGDYVLHLDGPAPNCPQAAGVSYRVFAPSYLAGVAAAAASQNGRAALIGGRKQDSVDEFLAGFAAGFEQSGGEIVETVYLADDNTGFADPGTARLQAERLYEQADVVFPAAGGSALGVFEAAKNAAGRFTFGVDADQADLGRGVIVGSVLKRLDLATRETVEDLAHGRFAAGSQTVGWERGLVEFRINDVFIGQVGELVDAARERSQTAEAQWLQENVR